MVTYTRLLRATRIFLLIPTIVLSGAIAAHAEKPPDSPDFIQQILPDSTSLQGKVVYIDFWASWCVPCRHSFPWMQELYREYHGRGFEIIAVNVDKDHAAALKFLKENPASFPIVFDSTGAIAKKYNLDAMPTSFIYGRTGKLETTHRGFKRDEVDGVDDTVLRLLREGETK